MKIKIHSELLYLFAIIILGLGVAFVSYSDFGVSMIAAPAYLLSLKTGISFGQCEYIVQGIVFILFCILVRKVKWVYFSSFLTCIFYGLALDLWREVLSILPIEYTYSIRCIFFLLGMLLSTLSIAMFLKVYLYPSVLDFFVKGITSVYKISFTKFKILFDFSCLFLSCFLSFIFFHKLMGIGIGTVIMTFCNGILISFFEKILNKILEVKPKFMKFSKYFDLG